MDRKSLTFSAGRVGNTISKRIRITVRLDDVRPSGVLRLFAVSSGFFVIIATFIAALWLTTNEQDRQTAAEKARSQQDALDTRSTQQTGNAAPQQEPRAEKQPPDSITRALRWLGYSGPADWALVIVGGLGIAAALMTLIAIQEQARIARKSAQAGLRAATAARKSADVAERALNTAERAYLAFSHWKIENLNEAGKDVIIRYNIVNTGHTPAWLVESGFSFTIAATLPKKLVYVSVKNEENTPLYPTMPIARPIQISDVSDAARQSAATHSMHLWFWGYYKYRDAFDAMHTSGFLMTLEGQKLVLDSRASGYTYAT